MRVLVMFSQYQAFVYAQSLKCKLRLYLKETMYFFPDTNGLKFIFKVPALIRNKQHLLSKWLR
jgi:hypothetical protein